MLTPENSKKKKKKKVHINNTECAWKHAKTPLCAKVWNDAFPVWGPPGIRACLGTVAKQSQSRQVLQILSTVAFSIFSTSPPPPPPQYSYPTPLFSTWTAGESTEDLNRSVVVPAADDMVEEDGPDEPGDDVETAFEEVCKILFMAVVFIHHCIFLSLSNSLFIPCPTVTYIYIYSVRCRNGALQIFIW